MQTLKKILEEIDIKVAGSMGKKREGLLEAQDIIRKHMNDEWIPAKNKPDEDAFYVATMSGTLVGQEVPFVGLAEFEDGEWVDGDDVVAWMPLPEPYCPEAKAPERKQEWKERMLQNFMKKGEK